MLEILTLIIIGTVCTLLIAFCVAIDRASGEQDDEKH